MIILCLLIIIIILIYILRKALQSSAAFVRQAQEELDDIIAEAKAEQFCDDEIEQMFYGTIITEIVPDQKDDQVIWDFSRYNEKHIIGMIIHSTESEDFSEQLTREALEEVKSEFAQEHGLDEEELEMIDEDFLKQYGFSSTTGIIKNAYVYKTVGGEMRWYSE